jgi:MtN3 and saliva related transmembrane protein
MNTQIIEVIGFVAAVLGTICWFPQALKTVRTRETRDLSLLTQAGFVMASSLWLVYGILITSWPVILSNMVTLPVLVLLLLFKLRFG